jgi:tetrapyrrole methylase family protein/MazG family protein
VLILRLCTPELAADVKRVLLNAYPPDFNVTLLRGNVTLVRGTEQIASCPLADLEQQGPFEAETALYLPPNPAAVGFATFADLVAHLLSPDGCPWDRAQTHQTLRRYLLEETYELLEVLDAGDLAAMVGELGDLLLQIALHAQMAAEAGHFRMGEVIAHNFHKMVRRHPHVFGDVVVSGADEVLTNWNAIKQAEKGHLPAAPSALDGVPPGLPALAQAITLAEKAARVGFEWEDIEGILGKIAEEAREIAEAIHPTHLEAEIGDLLFIIVQLARWRKVDPESALRSTNARFTRRFKKMEALAGDRPLAQLTLPKWQALWAEAKREEEATIGV